MATAGTACSQSTGIITQFFDLSKHLNIFLYICSFLSNRKMVIFFLSLSLKTKISVKLVFQNEIGSLLPF